MILINESESYKIVFNGKEYDVPKGKFEVTQELGTHIISKATMWGKKVYIENKNKMNKEQEIVPEVKQEIKEEISLPVEEKVEKIDTNKVLEEAEQFLKGK